jgi:uncharacterized protein DUF6088
MNVSNPLADKVLNRVQSGNGQIFSVADFLDLGPRPTVDQALSRLARQGKINRVRRGLYELPRIGKLLNRPITQSPDALARAWARKNGLRIVPSGAYAANLLGLSTNGRTKTIKLGQHTIKLLNRGPKTMDVQGKTSPLVFQALSYFGKEGVTQAMISRLRSLLTTKDKAELKTNLHHAPAWLQTVLKQIISQGKD